MKNNPDTLSCVGTGLLALDVIISTETNNSTTFLAGGSCGNVLTILSFLGWNCFPVARLSNNVATEVLLEDLERWGVKPLLISTLKDGSTPIIIHRILKDKEGKAKHRFEFKNPEDGKYLPSYKPFLSKKINDIFEKKQKTDVFFFDRVSRAAIDMAKYYKKKDAVVVFEPSNLKDYKGFEESLSLADIVKFSDERISNYDILYPVAKVPLEIQTMGENGLKFRKKGNRKWTNLNSFRIENVLDTAGAGDWATAGIINELFRNGKNLNLLSDEKIIQALKLGQILSALNCVFEGARGLMYSMSATDLLSFAYSIFESETLEIPKLSDYTNSHKELHRKVKISTLFESQAY